MSIAIAYRDGRLSEIGIYSPTPVRVNDCRQPGPGGSKPFVSVTVEDGSTGVEMYLSPDLADELRDALCQLPAIEPTP